MPLRARGTPTAALSDLLKLGLKTFLCLAAAEAALIGALMMRAKLRRRLQEEPLAPFPRAEQPEIELESSDERLKLYPDFERYVRYAEVPF